MTAQPGPGSTPTDIPGDVERIRAILFGSQMRDYEQRFQTLQRDLSRLQQISARSMSRRPPRPRIRARKCRACAQRC